MLQGASAKHNPQRVGLNHVIEDEDVLQIPSCKHAFHAKCLENWFAMSLTRLSADDLTCPLCRQAVPAAPRRRRDGEDATGEVELRDV